MTETIKKQHILFQVASDNVRDYGIGGLSYILKSQLKESQYFENQYQISNLSHNFEVSELFHNLKTFVNTYGLDKTIFFLQREKRYMDFGTIKHKKEELNNKVFEIVSETFETNSREIINQASRNGGKRVYSSGTITKLFFEVFKYPLDEITTLIPKTKSIISRHKFAVNKLDYRHP